MIEPKKVKEIEKHLFISDLQIPDQNKPLLELIYKFIGDYKPDKIHLVGDILNFTAVSKYDQDPYYHVTLANEIDEGRLFLDRLLRVSKKANSGVEVIWTEGNHECFDAETEILTKDGWITYDKITPDTLLCTFDKETSLLELEKPIAIQKYDYDGEMYAIKNRHTDLLITSNHRLHFKYSSNGPWQTKAISEMTIGDNRIYMKASSTFNNTDYKLSDDEIRIAAWLITDGCLVDQKYATFYQRKSKAYIIKDILDKLGWEYSTTERYRNITHIDGKKLKSHEAEIMFRLLGKYHKSMLKIVPQKVNLPKWVYKLSDKQFTVFLNSFIDGDGSRHKNAPETSLMVYGRKTLMEEMQKACFIHGYRTSLVEYRTGDFRLNITKNKTTSFDRFKNHVKKEQYNGVIWDVTTPNDTVIVKRNGKISITGNSRLIKYLGRNASALAEITGDDGEYINSIPHLFNLKRLGIKWVKYNQRYFEHGIRIEHGNIIRSKSGYTAHAMIDKTGCSGLSGHSHRLSMVHRTQGENQRFWIELGSMCNFKFQSPYVIDPDWQNGFAVATYLTSTRKFYPQLVPVIKNTFFINNKLYK